MATQTTIGVAARQAGVGVETIRFYERRGLIEQPPKPASSGVRHYSAATVARIRFVRAAQGIGFSLREISELLALQAREGADCTDVRARVQAVLAAVEGKIAQLRAMKAALKTLIAACPGRGGIEACSIMDALALQAAPRPKKPNGAGGDGQAKNR